MLLIKRTHVCVSFTWPDICFGTLVFITPAGLFTNLIYATISTRYASLHKTKDTKSRNQRRRRVQWHLHRIIDNSTPFARNPKVQFSSSRCWHASASLTLAVQLLLKDKLMLNLTLVHRYAIRFKFVSICLRIERNVLERLHGHNLWWHKPYDKGLIARYCWGCRLEVVKVSLFECFEIRGIGICNKQQNKTSGKIFKGLFDNKEWKCVNYLKWDILQKPY